MKSSYLDKNFPTTYHRSREHFFQPKLVVNAPGDADEQEADAVAEQVVHDNTMHNGPFFTPVNRGSVQRSHNGSVATDHQIDNDVQHLQGSGSSLSKSTQSFFQSRIGHDFSDVKIHTDEHAAKSASSINALAYTTGNHIVFNKNQYQPETTAGKKLLAHELTHVVQQKNGVSTKQIQRKEDPPEWTHYKSLPPLEAQETTWSCWAAALRSWLLVTPGRPTYNTQSDLITLYQTTPSGGIDPEEKIPTIAGDYSMDYEVISGRRFRGSRIARLLREKGHVIIMYNIATGIAHSHVVYGVGYPDGVNYRISVMDPSSGGGYKNMPVDFYTSKTALIIAYPN